MRPFKCLLTYDFTAVISRLVHERQNISVVISFYPLDLHNLEMLSVLVLRDFSFGHSSKPAVREQSSGADENCNDSRFQSAVDRLILKFSTGNSSSVLVHFQNVVSLKTTIVTLQGSENLVELNERAVCLRRLLFVGQFLCANFSRLCHLVWVFELSLKHLKHYFTEKRIEQMNSTEFNSLLVHLEGVLVGWKLCFNTRTIYM